MKSYSTYIFDWDGCLAKTLDIWLQGYKQELSNRGFNCSDSEITAIFGDWHGPSKLGVKDEKQFFQDMRPFIFEQMVQVELYPQVKETLSRLRARSAQIALLTSSVRDQVEPALEKHQLSQLFEYTITGLDVTKHKPDPEGINIIAKKLNTDLKTTLMIGDSDKDVQAANNAGIDSALFYPSEHSMFYQLNSLKQSHPTHIITNHRELLS